MNLHDCTCNQGRCACACGKGLCQKNSDGSDPNTEDDINPFAVQVLAVAVAAMVVSMLTGFALGAAARHLGWVS